MTKSITRSTATFMDGQFEVYAITGDCSAQTHDYFYTLEEARAMKEHVLSEDEYALVKIKRGGQALNYIIEVE